MLAPDLQGNNPSRRGILLTAERTGIAWDLHELNRWKEKL